MEQPFLCEKGDAKKLNTFFKDFKLYMPLPDYATMQLVWKTCECNERECECN